MTTDRTLTFYHAPQTRSTGVAFLLDELGAPHQRVVLNMKANEQRKPAYLAINPMGKVPAIMHGDALVTEQGAIFIYLADLFPKAGLAPALDDPLRGPYLRWLVYYGSSFEPAVIDVAMKREPSNPTMSAYGDFDTVMKTVNCQLSRGLYMLGERFSAADILWGMALSWTTHFGLVPKTPAIQDYIARIAARPAYQRVTAEDAVLVAAHEKAAQ